ncbi:sensor of ECF-type sigma factor [Leeuwenhoekiella aequorea]|uniref:sensor of ECF-type sigma factor n=1 Tax=Leeuwenhoekiella TaxID=283735 RepID=UPI00352F79ED|tara:strand:- start:293 stop:730 length:438 start_codon:yes stop_codon:yes gene_type:complete
MRNLIIILGLLIGVTSYAQNDHHERIKSLKVSFLTEELNLTPSEAEKFWPIYNIYDSKMNDLRNRERSLFKQKYGSSGSKNTFSESEANKLIAEYNDILEKRFALESSLMSDLTRKLPASKMMFLPEVEHKFGKKLWEEYRKRKK